MPHSHDRIGSRPFTGLNGDAWVVWCRSTLECVVVDRHHATEAADRFILEGRLTLIASVGTATLPKVVPGDGHYLDLLSDLGLTPEQSEDPSSWTVGPIAGWGGSRLAQVGPMIVELDRSAESSLVCRSEGRWSPRPHRVNVASVIVKFGEHSATAKAYPGCPVDTLGWRIGRRIFVDRYHGEPVPGFEVVATGAAGRADPAVVEEALESVREAVLDLQSWAHEVEWPFAPEDPSAEVLRELNLRPWRPGTPDLSRLVN